MSAANEDELVCIELVELVTDYLEDALPAEQRRRFEDHLRECPFCIEYVEQMRMVGRDLGGLADESITPAARDALLAAFRNLRAPP